jgi:hypothetical protein
MSNAETTHAKRYVWLHLPEAVFDGTVAECVGSFSSSRYGDVRSRTFHPGREAERKCRRRQFYSQQQSMVCAEDFIAARIQYGTKVGKPAHHMTIEFV